MPRRKPSGRTPALTPEVQARFCEHVAAGVPLKYAAAAAGVSARSVRRWLAAGRAGESPAAVALLSAYKKADAEGVAARVGRIADAARNGSWQADAWHLERTKPEHFATDRRELRELRRQLADLTARLARLAPPDAPDPTPPRGPAA